MLDARHTRIKRARVGDPAYKFHTKVLGVNRQIHDEAYPDQEATFTAKVLPLDRCSISQLPFPAMSSYKNIESLKEYTTVRKRNDLQSLMSLSDETKAEINRLQKEHGLQVTDFDLVNVDFDQKDKIEKSR